MSDEWQKALVINQKVQVTVWDVQDDTVEYSFNSHITEVGGNMLALAPPTKQAALIYPLLQQGVVLGVMIETDPSPYIFYPLIASEPASENSDFWLKIPENTQVEFVQWRRHVRIPMVIPFELEYLLSGCPIPMSAHTEDLSGGGMRFTCARMFPLGQELNIKLPLTLVGQVLQLKAKVVFSAQKSPHKMASEDLYIVACQFQDLKDVQEMALVRECFRRELDPKQQ
jgi:c-di-GMP-binding flagellar brake protein YcgR